MRRGHLHAFLAVALLTAIYVGSYACALTAYQYNAYVSRMFYFRTAAFHLPMLSRFQWGKDFLEQIYKPLLYVDEVYVRPAYWGYANTDAARAAWQHQGPPYLMFVVTPAKSAAN